jgi:hypothetical protein
MNRKRKSPSEDRLIQELNSPNFSTKTTKITNSLKGRKTLERLARKWAARGYYSTPSEAMNALLGEI